MMTRGAQLALLTVFILLGVMLSVQFRVQQQMALPLPYQRQEEMTERLLRVEKERDALRDEVARLRTQVAGGESSSQDLRVLENELRLAQTLAGLTEVKGLGVIVTIDDSKFPRQKNEDPNKFILHDEDLLKVVNELSDAGAEAISVNGQRLTATSEIRCAGSVISINNTRTAPPVKILAIGDPATLEAALKLRGGIADTLALWGIEVTIKKENEVIVPAYKGALNFQFAKPVRTGG